MAFFSWLKEDSDITAILFRYPKRFNPLNAATQNILRGPGEMSFEQREFLAAFVSGVNSCSFCHSSHKAVALVYGVDEKQLDSAISDLEATDLDPKMKPILRMAEKLTKEPSRMIQSDIEAITAVGWSEDTAHDAVVICALFNFYNRMLDGHGIKGSEEKAAKSARFLPKFGYKIPWFVRWFAKLKG